MINISALIRAKELSQEILEAAASEDIERIQHLENMRSKLLPQPADFTAISRLPEEQKKQALALVSSIIELNDATRLKLAPWHEDLQVYTRRLKTIKQHYETDQPSFGNPE